MAIFSYENIVKKNQMLNETKEPDDLVKKARQYAVEKKGNKTVSLKDLDDWDKEPDESDKKDDRLRYRYTHPSGRLVCFRDRHGNTVYDMNRRI